MGFIEFVPPSPTPYVLPFLCGSDASGFHAACYRPFRLRSTTSEHLSIPPDPAGLPSPSRRPDPRLTWLYQRHHRIRPSSNSHRISLWHFSLPSHGGLLPRFSCLRSLRLAYALGEPLPPRFVLACKSLRMFRHAPARRLGHRALPHPFLLTIASSVERYLLLTK
jgi:hypothetical protein